ncbi:MAG: hypothetical protein U0790_09895 [Isosphaeraceae bacterium]
MVFTIHFEQAVYGSFRFWDRGYSVLARSEGCRDEWLAALKLAARRFGEPPPGAGAHACLFASRIARGPWMIAGVFPQGCDDKGRPGALAFHALFVGTWAYRMAGASPFPFRPALRGDWASGDIDGRLPGGSLRLDWRDRACTAAGGPDDDLPRRAAEALGRGRRVLLESSEPIDELARRVWARLPGRVRRRASVATWAYGNENRFDLLGTPRIPGADRDGRALILEQADRGPQPGSTADLDSPA